MQTLFCGRVNNLRIIKEILRNAELVLVFSSIYGPKSFLRSGLSDFGTYPLDQVGRDKKIYMNERITNLSHLMRR